VVGFGGGFIDALQPASHPSQCGLSPGPAVVVLVGVLEQVHPLAEAERAVEALGLAETLPRAVDVEEVLRCGEDKGGLGRPHREVVGVLDAESDLRRDVLLAVLRALLREESLEARYVAGRCGREDPVIGDHEVGGDGAAAGVARAADAPGVDLGPAGQVIDGTDGVPDAVMRRAQPDEARADVHQSMLGGAPRGRFAPGVERLDALALADRVVAEDGEATAGQQDAEALVIVGGLSDAVVAAGH
jgi:hypothetical protein